MYLPGDPLPGHAASRYKVLERKRQPYLDEARKCAALTIPWVCPPTRYRTGGRADLPKPNQGLGARGISNLTGKFLTVLMPPGMPFYKVGLTAAVERDLANQEQAGAAVALALSAYEMDIVVSIAQDGDRAGIASGMLHLPITGNVLLQLLAKGGVRHFGIDQFVVRRGGDGKMLETILCEVMPLGSLDKDHQTQLKAAAPELTDDEETVEVYTRVYRHDDGRYYEYQEAEGVILDDTDGQYPDDECPWLPLRWSYVAGEDYGRGLIEATFKDWKKFDELSEALGDAAKNAAKLIWMTGGGGATALVARLSKAKSGDFVAGDASQVKALQQEKANDLQVAYKQHEALKTDLSLICLLGTAIQRGGDRVTKFEVEYLARELEAVYSNEYTIIGREFQEPYFKAKSAQLRRRGVIPALPPKALKVQITTGIDALGRGSDQMRMESLADIATKASQLPPQLMNAREFLRRSAANLAVKPDGLIPSDEEVQAQEQKAQQAALIQQVAPEMIRGASEAGLAQQAAALEQQSQPPEGEPSQP